MMRFALAMFGIGWVIILAVGLGLVAQDNKIGFGPIALLGTSIMTGLMGATEDKERRVPLLLLAAAAFASLLAYAVMRYFMLFAWPVR